MNKINKVMMVILTAVIVFSFFLPWIRIEVPRVKIISGILTGKAWESDQYITGFQIPLIANSEEARLMINMIKAFNPKISSADKKSYLVWLMPALAITMLLLSFVFGSNRWFNLILGILGFLIFSVAVYKIKHTNLDKVAWEVNIGKGLWLSLWAYLGIGITGLISFLKSMIKQTN